MFKLYILYIQMFKPTIRSTLLQATQKIELKGSGIVTCQPNQIILYHVVVLLLERPL